MLLHLLHQRYHENILPHENTNAMPHLGVLWYVRLKQIRFPADLLPLDFHDTGNKNKLLPAIGKKFLQLYRHYFSFSPRTP